MNRARQFVAWLRGHPNRTVVIVCVVVLAAFVWVIRGNRENAAQGLQAHDALCVFKGDLERRAQASRDFLKKPPQTILGIPVNADVIAQVQSDLKNREATIRSLAELDCGEEVGGAV